MVVPSVIAETRTRLGEGGKLIGSAAPARPSKPSAAQSARSLRDLDRQQLELGELGMCAGGSVGERDRSLLKANRVRGDASRCRWDVHAALGVFVERRHQVAR